MGGYLGVPAGYLAEMALRQGVPAGYLAEVGGYLDFPAGYLAEAIASKAKK